MHARPNPKKPLIISFISQYVELAIHFVGILFLARLLSPEETGSYSVAAFLMTLLHVFRDFGVARYIVQEPDLTTQMIRSAQGVAIILAWAVALILFLSSSLIAGFYQTPEIENILVVMSISFAVSPAGAVLIAIFRRNMQFGKIFIVRLVSALCHVGVAITLAVLDYGAISLAWANLAGILSYGVIAVLLKSRTTPLLPQFRNFREILSFGSISSVGTVANVTGMNAPDVIIGKVISLAAAGHFSRGNGLIQIFRTLVTGSVMPLTLAYFSQIRREEGDLAQPYHAAVEYLTVVAWPFFATMGLLALPIVRTLYGPQWDASVPIVQLLCIAGAISMIGTFAGEVMIANGHVRQVTKFQILTSAIRIVAILAVCRYGFLSAVAIALIFSEICSLGVVSH